MSANVNPLIYGSTAHKQSLKENFIAKPSFGAIIQYYLF